MMRDGPIPVLVHGLIEYVAGILLIVAPLLIGYDSGTATAVSVVVGILILIIAATTAGPTGLIPQIPLPAHVALDYVLAAFLIASPFIFSFSSESAPTAIFIALGILHLLLTIGTRFSSGSRVDPGPAPRRD
jgi:VIT1/CCC1 family predicted Fe2+/Mn2+ transporter